MIKFTIDGPPLGKTRHRTGSGRTYNPQSEVEAAIKWEIKAQLPKSFRPFTGPCRVDILALFQRPKSHYGTGRNSDKLKKSAPMMPTVKPDIDNISKLYKDCMNGVVYVDDQQVCDASQMKRYADRGSRPCVIITVQEVAG